MTAATTYDDLIHGYYGGRRHHHRHHRHHRRRASDYGNPYRGREAHEDEHLLAGYGHHRHRHHHRRHAHEKAPPDPTSSVDDGETLEHAARAGRHEEEYVIAASLGNEVSEEYVVDCAPLPGQASRYASSAEHTDRAFDAKAEYLVDVADPLAGATQRPAPAPRPETAAPTAPETAEKAPSPGDAAGTLVRAPTESAPAPNAGAPQDDDFIADLKSILTRQKVYDPVSKKTVSADDPNRAVGGANDPGQPRKDDPNAGMVRANSQAIFDKIAQSMQYANAYDLGTVELESRFADFDRMSDLQKANSDKRSGRAHAAQPNDAVATATDVDGGDFIQDLDTMHRQRGQGFGRRSAPDQDPFAYLPPEDPLGVQAPGLGAGWTGGAAPGGMGAGAGGGIPGGAPAMPMPSMPSIPMPNIQIPNIQIPNIQMPGMPAPQMSGEQAASTSTNLSGDFVASALQTVFGKAADINRYFANLGAPDFVGWFNQNLAKRGPWANKDIGSGTEVAGNFQAIWDNIPQIFGTSQINLLQFASLMSILINEVGGKLAPISELVGTKEHPGIAYAFDSIPNLKTSYNDGGSNWTAYRCFNDADFIAAHGGKALGGKLQNTTDPRWSGHEYPRSDYPASTDPSVSGFILEADFYKFRGRGLIQTTWRGAYLNLIRFIQDYAGTQPEIVARKTAWAGMDANKAANVSANADWDALFMNSNMEIPCVAVAQHSSGAGNYLSLSGDMNALNGKGQGSIWRMGRAISGSGKYADLFRHRVLAICNLLGN